jgi:protease PrsW
MGQFRSTKAGLYLVSLKNHFSPEMLVDLYCYISLYLELSIKAKRNLMLKENGFSVMAEKDLMPKLKELAAIRKKIGLMGESALAPLIRMNYKNLWKLNRLQDDAK